MNRPLRLLPIFLILLAMSPSAMAQVPSFGPPKGKAVLQDVGTEFNDSRDKVKVTAAIDRSQLKPGSDAVIAVILDHEPGWHTWTNPGNVPEGMVTFDGAVNTEIKIKEAKDSPVAAHAAFIQWPAVHSATADLGDGPKKYAVFADRAIAFLPVTISPKADPGRYALDLLITFQSCNAETCMAPVFDHEVPVELNVVAADAAIAPTPRDGAIFANFDETVFARLAEGAGANATATSASPPQSAATAPAAAPRPTFFGVPLPSTDGLLGGIVLIVLSMLGGFILNLTPCVLPIIPIKILTISQHAGSPGRSFQLGLWMALGVVAFWAAIGVPAALFSAAADPSRIFGIWWLTLGLGVLIALMGVGIMGLFTIQLPAAVYSVNPKADTAWGSFVFGIMTAVLGLPCFGFVAGALLAGAATLPAVLVMLIFTSIGVGMALPYLVLSAKPALVNRIPRTGPASELVKQVMGLLLLAAAAYFIGSGLITLTMDEPYIAKQLHWWIAAVFAALAGLWLIVRTFQITKKPAPRVAFAIAGLVIGAAAIAFALDRTDNAKAEWQRLASTAGSNDFVPGAWNDYTPERFANARKSGRIVVLDFTASWCLTCQFLKATVLDPDPVKSAFEKEDIVVFSVDLSSLKAPGWEHLRSLGKTGIPLLAIYAPGAEQPWLANAYTADQVLAAIQDARANKLAAR